MMKYIKRFGLLLAFVTPFSAHAEGSMVGTSALLLSTGVTNVYYQGKLNNSGAWTAAYSSVANLDLSSFGLGTISANMISAGYKAYVNSYGNGAYYHFGAGMLNVSSSSSGAASGLLPFAVVGYEAKLGGGLVLDGEAGLGTGSGWGLLGLNVAYSF